MIGSYQLDTETNPMTQPSAKPSKARIKMIAVPAGDLTPLMLDWLVAGLEDVPVLIKEGSLWHNSSQFGPEGIYAPSTDPATGHIILEREKIQLRYVEEEGHSFHQLWMAKDCRFRPTSGSVEWTRRYGHSYAELEYGHLTGPTMLIAGLRFYVAKAIAGKTKTPMLRVPADIV